MASRVLVTAALPYANGSIHLGHMLEFIQTDVYVRARKLAGEDVVFMWADDTHGTAIQLRAQREGITPEELIERAHAEHKSDFDDFGIGYDIFYTTHSEENRKHAGAIFEAMRERGDILTKEIEQLFCPKDQIFLPDRFVKGTCPNCKAPEQYGDVCENCSKTYDPTDLEAPQCSQCGTTPELRNSEHLFVPLSRHEPFLRKWLARSDEGGKTRIQDSVRNSLMSWMDDLRDWDISREAPYFGFEIPGHPGKYFYVWFDAPIGYIAATDKWCAREGADFDTFWKSTPEDTEIVHVIGKDIVYFHCLFWPAMLNAAGYTVPSQVQVHGWLTVNGQKMSKSRGTFILARTYLEQLPADYLRYYFAAKLSSAQDDLDLSMEDFANRVNADLVNKAANLASRCIKFIAGKLGGTTGELPEDAAPLLADARAKLAEVPQLYRQFEFSRALRIAMEISEACNVYITEKAPWKLAKSDPETARSICSVGVQVSKMVAAILAPVLPEWAAKTERMLKMTTPLAFHNAAESVPAGTVLAQYEALAERLDPKKLDAIIEASKETIGGADAEASAGEFDYEVEPLADESTIDALGAVDLRVAKIVACETVEGSKKLLRLSLDLGPLGQRQVLSGISQSYEPEALVGLHVVVFANLKPRKMRFGVSEGMVMAAGQSDDAVTVLTLDSRSRPGDKVT
jgi:methionyl-tRNA synthetase